MYGPLNLSQYIYSGKLLNDWNDEDMDAEGLLSECQWSTT